MQGIHQHVHEHLVQFQRQTFDLRQVAVFLDYLGLVLDFIVGDVEVAIDGRMHIRSLPIFGRHPDARFQQSTVDHVASPDVGELLERRIGIDIG